jgi:formylglycine-generating enzyme required for sulfatase activity
VKIGAIRQIADCLKNLPNRDDLDRGSTSNRIEDRSMRVVSSLVISASMLSSIASASVTIDWVTVGNAGNAADPLTSFGAVAYEYQIGKYEVTNAQYGAFLNAKGQSNSNGIYNSSMSSYGISQSGSSGNYTYSVTTALANRPVVYVSWFDAARFANWMMNGQGSGSTETGAYTLNGATDGIILANAGAQVYIPTEDEWYKAAYYNAASQIYSLYPNGQNTITTMDANYANPFGSSTDVGFYSADPSTYGTFDQGGNVWEWNDAVKNDTRGIRGGAWEYWSIGNSVERDLRSTYRLFYMGNPSSEGESVGFRLAAVPEPSSLVLTMLASGVVLIRRKR